jgi:hypothetical protein
VSVALVVLLAVAVGAQAASSADVALKRSLASLVGMRNGRPAPSPWCRPERGAGP